jgi:uncharacterized delta-60 repeat protein/uncharacterized repeat protein (TIGR01451 family)
MPKGLTHSSRGTRLLRRALTAITLASLFIVPLTIRFGRTVHAAGTISLNTISVPVTENFNTLINGANDTISSAGIPNGWDFIENGSGANTTYRTGTGSGTTGDTYSFGTPTTSTDRAFGQLRSGTVSSNLGASFTNNTGSTVNALAISYTGEQWRLGATGRTIAERWDFQYSTNATSLSTGTYTDFDALDFTPPVTAGTVGALDGNAAANRKVINSTITGLSIPNGATFWIRWSDVDATGADDGLGIDDFSLTPLGGSIGTTGVRTTDIQGTDDGGYALALQPDGKIVVGGYAVNNSGNKDFALVRYNYNGTLDTTFNGTGKVVTDFNGTSDRIWGLTLQTDGKIVAVGETVSLVFPGTNDIAVARYNTNGTLDTTFGGTGKVTTDHGGGANNAAYGVAMSGTNIIVAGYEAVSGNNDFMVARYTTAGVLDPTFGTLGVTTLGFSGGNDIARAVAIDGSGNIVLGGYANNGSNDDFAVARFTPAGALDTTFVAGAGKAAVDIANGGVGSADQAFALVIAGNTIVLGGSAYNNGTGNKDFALVRYNNAGALQGIVTTDFGNSPDVVQALAVQSNNKVVAAGFSRNSTSSDDFALARYNTDGTLDTTFDGDGKLTMRINNADERAYGVAQQFDGKLVAAGFATVLNTNPVQHDFALARFNADGTLDSTNAASLNNPDLLVNVTGPQSPNSVVAGSPFTYNVSVENRGAVNATNVVLTNTLPAGVSYVSHTASQGTSNEAGGVVTNNVGTLAPGATATLTINVTAGNTPMLVVDTATATLTETDLSPANNTATEYTRIIGITDLSFSPSTVTGGCQNSTGTITLSGPAPGNGVQVSISSAEPLAASAPAQVLVSGGQTSAQFTVTTGAVATNRNVRFEATLGPTSFVRRLVVNAGCF